MSGPGRVTVIKGADPLSSLTPATKPASKAQAVKPNKNLAEFSADREYRTASLRRPIVPTTVLPLAANQIPSNTAVVAPRHSVASNSAGGAGMSYSASSSTPPLSPKPVSPPPSLLSSGKASPDNRPPLPARHPMMDERGVQFQMPEEKEVPEELSSSLLDDWASYSEGREVPGEKLVMRIDDVYYCRMERASPGTLVMTSYQMYFEFPKRIPLVGTVAIPLSSIDKLETIKEKNKQKQYEVYLDIVCKDIRTLRFAFKKMDLCKRAIMCLTQYVFPPKDDFLFAFYYKLKCEMPPEWDGWNVYDPLAELRRMGLGTSGGYFRVTDLNHEFALCHSYPRHLVVPSHHFISDADVRAIANFRSRGRIPVCVWKHPVDDMTIWRCSQPRAGFNSSRCLEDERYFAFISDFNKHTNTLTIFDARPKLNAVGNKIAGKGFENTDFYKNCKIRFMNIQNIHVMRDSYQKMCRACTRNVHDQRFLTEVMGSGWLFHISEILRACFQMVQEVDKEKSSIVSHCSDGWDRTAQLVSLTMLCLDPYYRTTQGFFVLIEKEWLSYGHKFQQRCGHRSADSTDENRSPIFLQWVDCVWQLTQQFPQHFEFNSAMLVALMDHLTSCRFGTFMCNTLEERVKAQLRTRTVSLWSYLLFSPAALRGQFTNPAYVPEGSGDAHLPSFTTTATAQASVAHRPNLPLSSQADVPASPVQALALASAQSLAAGASAGPDGSGSGAGAGGAGGAGEEDDDGKDGATATDPSLTPAAPSSSSGHTLGSSVFATLTMAANMVAAAVVSPSSGGDSGGDGPAPAVASAGGSVYKPPVIAEHDDGDDGDDGSGSGSANAASSTSELPSEPLSGGVSAAALLEEKEKERARARLVDEVQAQKRLWDTARRRGPYKGAVLYCSWSHQKIQIWADYFLRWNNEEANPASVGPGTIPPYGAAVSPSCSPELILQKRLHYALKDSNAAKAELSVAQSRLQSLEEEIRRLGGKVPLFSPTSHTDIFSNVPHVAPVPSGGGSSGVLPPLPARSTTAPAALPASAASAVSSSSAASAPAPAPASASTSSTTATPGKPASDRTSSSSSSSAASSILSNTLWGSVPLSSTFDSVANDFASPTSSAASAAAAFPPPPPPPPAAAASLMASSTPAAAAATTAAAVSLSSVSSSLSSSSSLVKPSSAGSAPPLAASVTNSGAGGVLTSPARTTHLLASLTDVSAPGLFDAAGGVFDDVPSPVHTLSTPSTVAAPAVRYSGMHVDEGDEVDERNEAEQPMKEMVEMDNSGHKRPEADLASPAAAHAPMGPSQTFLESAFLDASSSSAHVPANESTGSTVDSVQPQSQ